ncbi:MAG: hypothetical protein ACRYG7_16390 [Janthinobacterium lividum]
MTITHLLERPDFIVSSTAGEEQLVVEVKKWGYENPQLSQLVETHFTQRPYYFLLATPEAITLWPPAGPGQTVLPVSTPAAEVLANYLDIKRHPLHKLGEAELGLLVSSWLDSIMFKPAQTLRGMPAQSWLVESGLHERIYRGFIRREKPLF